jgi:hypothetical protein
VVDWPGAIDTKAMTAVLNDLNRQIQQASVEVDDGQTLRTDSCAQSGPLGFKARLLQAAKGMKRFVPPAMWPIVVEAPHGDIRLALENVLVVLKLLLGIISEKEVHAVRSPRIQPPVYGPGSRWSDKQTRVLGRQLRQRSSRSMLSDVRVLTRGDGYRVDSVGLPGKRPEMLVSQRSPGLASARPNAPLQICPAFSVWWPRRRWRSQAG